MKGYKERCEGTRKVLVTGDINTRVGDSEFGGVLGKFEILGMNDRERKLSCAWKGFECGKYAF